MSIRAMTRRRNTGALIAQSDGNTAYACQADKKYVSSPTAWATHDAGGKLVNYHADMICPLIRAAVESWLMPTMRRR